MKEPHYHEHDQDSEPKTTPDERRAELTTIQEEDLDDMAYDLLETDQDAIDLRKALQEARSRGDRFEEEQLVGAIKFRMERLREELRDRYGFPDREKEHREALRLKFQGIGLNDSEEDILRKLGMLKEGQTEDGQPTVAFQYPRDLFTEHTNKLWDEYIDLVKTHATTFEKLKRSQLTDPEWRAVDQRRVNAHDLFTQAMMHDLGLEASNENLKEDENFIFCRRLAAKMRDELFPNRGELATTVQKVSELLSIIRGHEDKF